MSPVRVLVVEDNPVTLALYRAILAEEVELLEAQSLAEARQSLARASPDMALLDLVLPDGSGQELMEEIRARGDLAHIPILAVSGFLAPDVLPPDSGFDEILLKPLDPDRLLAAVLRYVSPSPTAGARGERSEVLVVDDQRDRRRQLATLLTREGFRTRTADSGGTALEELRVHRPDLLLTDVLMPEVDGFELTLRIREDPELADLPVVLVSTHFGSERDQELADAVGAHALVSALQEDGEARVVEACLSALREPPRSPAVSATPDLRAQHRRIVLEQLEAQAQTNRDLLRAASMERAQRALLTRVTEGLSRHGDHEGLLPELLTDALDAAGVSNGALLRVEGGALVPRATLGLTGGREQVAPAWGNPRFLRRVLESRENQWIVPPGSAEEYERRLVAAFAGAAVHVLPIRFRGEVLGALLLGSRRGRLDGTSGLEFAELLAGHLAQTLALLRVFEDLDETEERFRILAETLDVVLWIVEVPTREVTYASPGYEKVWGRPVSEALGDLRHFGATIHPEDRARVVEGYFERASAGPYELRYRILRPDGRVAWIRDRGYPLRDDAGELVRVVGLAQDVTEDVRREEDLHRARALSQEVLAAGLHPIVVLDASLRPYMVNRAFRECFGLRSTGAHNPLDPHGAAAVLEALPELQERLPSVLGPDGSPIHDLEARARVGGEDRTLRVHATPLREEGAAAVLVTLEDLTATRTLEESFFQSQKMESMGQLAGGIAHDFNNILTVISGCIDLVLEDVQEEDPLREDLEKIRDASSRGSSLTRQLLTLGRQSPSSPEVIGVPEATEDGRRVLERALGEDIDFRIEIPPDTWPIRVDPGQFNQVLLNLAINARDAMPHGGSLTVEAANRTLDGDPLLPDLSPGEYVELVVRDTGTGMDEAVRKRVFEPFFTTKPEGKGTGLGLASVFGIIRQSGGDLRVESSLGEGTTFRIFLPRAEGEPTRAPAAASDPPAAGGRSPDGTTLLFVEDDEDLRFLGVRALRRQGYTVWTAGSPGEALLLLEKEARAPDMIVTDVIMPGMDGAELVRRVRDTYGEVRVLYVSGYTADVVLAKGDEDEEVEFLPKPFRPRELVERVRRVLGR